MDWCSERSAAPAGGIESATIYHRAEIPLQVVLMTSLGALFLIVPVSVRWIFVGCCCRGQCCWRCCRALL